MHISQFHLKEPCSALTHMAAFFGAVLLTPQLLIHAAGQGSGRTELSALGIFMLSMTLLYLASTVYHSLNLSPRANLRLKKLDHMMIYVLIAGTYTPVCLIGLPGNDGLFLLGVVWAIALIGLVITGFWVNCPCWVSAVIYICMGWVCLMKFPQIIASLPLGGFLWLLAGGILYTIGGVIYAMKLNLFRNRFPNFGSHEVFHLFVMAGSLCHFVLMYHYLSNL